MSRKEDYYSYAHCFIFVLLHAAFTCLSVSEYEALLTFRKSLQNIDSLEGWGSGKGGPCSGRWSGVTCSGGHVSGLDLENMGLRGIVNVDALMELEHLKTLNLKSNYFSSTLPDFKHVKALETLLVSNNSFAGEIPDDAFDKMKNLKTLDLGTNKFLGTIPASSARLSKLKELRLEMNRFEGRIPDFMVKEDLKVLNVSHNKLDGPIPKSLYKMGQSAFVGNRGLCGGPMGQCHSSETDTKKPTKLSIAVLATAVVAALVAIAHVILIILHHRSQRVASVEDPLPPAGKGKGGVGENKLTFLREGREDIELQELLKASAEVLETSGTFGFSYKAGLGMGKVVVVKRYTHLNNLGKREFSQHMKMLGSLRHPNLHPTVAYLYNKEEKLFISDYVDMGSLATRIHGHQSLGQPSLNWAIRLKIVKGIAKGLQHLYKELPSLITPHGHLKSSKVLLKESYEPLLTDYGLSPIVNQEDAQELMVAYQSPEYEQHNRITKKTDVWAFGVLVLEILTGRFPMYQAKAQMGMDLVTWARSIFHGELLINVIDKEMRLTKSSEGEIFKLLKLALECCEEQVDKRPDMRVVAEKVQELKEGAVDEDDL